MTITQVMLDAVTPRLSEFGLTKRAGGVFTRDLTADSIGWLGLNAAVKHMGGQAVRVLPIIGVRHHPTERLVAELAGQAHHKYAPPTISQPIGQLMSPRRNATWTIDRNDPVPAVDEMVDAIATYGISFMRANATLEAIRARIADGLHSDHSQEPYREATAAVVAGAADAAFRAVERGVDVVSSRADQAAENFLTFAQNLREHIQSQSA